VQGRATTLADFLLELPHQSIMLGKLYVINNYYVYLFFQYFVFITSYCSVLSLFILSSMKIKVYKKYM
jgi:hypothetical protein